MVATNLMTADELLRLSPDEARFELIAGERVDMSPTGSRHFVVSLRINQVLWKYLDAHPIGGLGGAEGGFLLERNPDTVLAPDYAFVTNDQIAQLEINPEGFAKLAPALVVEIKSPSNTKDEIDDKTATYLRAGVAEVWWLRPEERALTVHRSNRDPEVMRAPAIFSTSEVLPGIAIDLAVLFG